MVGKPNLTPAGARLEGNKKKSRWAGRNPNEEREAARRRQQLDRARDALFQLIDQFTKILKDQRLRSNKSTRDMEKQTQLLERLPRIAAELDVRNKNEGTQSLLSMCLNSIIVMRDDNNDLRYQNYILNKKMEHLKRLVEDKLGEPVVFPKDSPEDDSPAE